MSVHLLHYSDLEDAYDHPDRVGRLAGLIRELRTDRTLVVGSGDDLALGVLETVTELGKRQALAFLDAVGADVDTVGNHDLDPGPPAFLHVARDAPVTWVCSNVRLDGEPFGRDAGIRETAVLEAGDARVGFLGLAHPGTPEFAPAASALEVVEPVPAARDAVAALREDDVDYTVCLSHLGESEAVARAVDVDVVLEGHHHERRVERVGRTVVARSAGNGRDLTEVSLGDRPSIEVHEVEDGPLDESTASTYRRRLREAGVDEVVATADDPIERTYATRFHGESPLGNLVADAYLSATEADVALVPGGGLRMGDPLVGEVTVGDVVGTVPYDEPLVTCSVDGATLRQILSNAEGDGPADQPPWWHFQLAGGRVVWDHAASELVELRVGGDQVERDRAYELATTRYLVDYEWIPVGPDDVLDEYGPQYRAVVEFVRENGLDPTVEGRIERRDLPE